MLIATGMEKWRVVRRKVLPKTSVFHPRASVADKKSSHPTYVKDVDPEVPDH